jgi:GNAT superfamily N-acetyltransferase
MAIVIAGTDDDALLAGYYHRHWLSMGLAPADVAPAWRDNALGFIAGARRGRAFAGFVARDAGGPVGGAGCHLVERAYPAFRVADAPVVGYVWGVYVEPASRGVGVGAALVRACLDHLSARGCGRVLLHAGERSRPLYERLGFAPTDELALALDAGS